MVLVERLTVNSYSSLPWKATASMGCDFSLRTFRATWVEIDPRKIQQLTQLLG